MGRGGVDQDLALGSAELVQGLDEAVDRLDRDRVWQRQPRRELARIDEPAAGAVPVEQGVAQHQRVVGDVAAAQVEQPGYRIRQR